MESYLATQSLSQVIEGFDFLLDPEITPESPFCRRCNQLLSQEITYEENEVEVVWICRKCGNAVYETDGQI